MVDPLMMKLSALEALESRSFGLRVHEGVMTFFMFFTAKWRFWGVGAHRFDFEVLMARRCGGLGIRAYCRVQGFRFNVKISYRFQIQDKALSLHDAWRQHFAPSCHSRPASRRHCRNGEGQVSTWGFH